MLLTDLEASCRARHSAIHAVYFLQLFFVSLRTSALHCIQVRTIISIIESLESEYVIAVLP